MKAFKVLLNNREIDKIFYPDNSNETAHDVKRSLINQDGYDPRIEVTLERKSVKRDTSNASMKTRKKYCEGNDHNYNPSVNGRCIECGALELPSEYAKSTIDSDPLGLNLDNLIEVLDLHYDREHRDKIVRAVNSHDKLVELLKDVLESDYIDHMGTLTPVLHDGVLRGMIVNAIAKTEGK